MKKLQQSKPKTMKLENFKQQNQKVKMQRMHKCKNKLTKN